MGCDIHSFAEVRQADGSWKTVGNVFPLHELNCEEGQTHGPHPFDWRSYGLFGFLADVRNYSQVPVISPPKNQIPEDASQKVKETFDAYSEYHNVTWLSLRQLLDFDYDQMFWNRRVMRDGNGAATAVDLFEGEHLTVREFLGPQFFRDLEILQTLGDPENVRVVFGFDS